MIPARIPTMMQIEMARPRMPGEMEIGKDATAEMIVVSMNTRKTPIAPPMMHRKADSSRNSVSITDFRAPRAFLSPI
jgi:hypothetical protein